jgi:hypothetical protein
MKSLVYVLLRFMIGITHLWKYDSLYQALICVTEVTHKSANFAIRFDFFIKRSVASSRVLVRSSLIALCGLLSGNLSGLMSSLPSILLTLESNREELGKSDRYFLLIFSAT